MSQSESSEEKNPGHDHAEGSVINLEKHFRAKQIRNRRTLREEPGALVLLRVFNPREPA